MPTKEAILTMLGRRIRTTRRAKDWTQGELAKRTGLHLLTISRIEHAISKEVYVNTVRAIAKALEVTTDFLLGLPEEDTEKSEMVGPLAWLKKGDSHGD